MYRGMVPLVGMVPCVLLSLQLRLTQSPTLHPSIMNPCSGGSTNHSHPKNISPPPRSPLSHLSYYSYLIQGCHWEDIQKAELHFVVSKPVCVGDVQCPKGPMTKSQKGPRERNMSLVSEIISSDLGESQESIFWCKIGDLRYKTSRQTFPANQNNTK